MDGLLFFRVMDGGKAFGIDNSWLGGWMERLIDGLVDG